MSARILLVTGSRALEGSAHEERARVLLATFCESYAPTMIVAGDANGPDDWAATWATARNHDLRIYGLDGTVSDGGRVLRRWTTAEEFSPLDRNVAMVRGTAAQRAKGAHVEAVGIEAAWSATMGAAHTLAAARGAGLSITRIVFDVRPQNDR